MLPRASRRARRAFTLVEVIAALAITGLLLPLAWAYLGQSADNRDRVTVAVAGHAEVGNGGRLLRSLVERTVAGSDTLSAFKGQQFEARFGSWCQSTSGWLERCSVRLSINRDRRAILVETEGAESVVALRSTRPLAFAYALLSGGAIRWQGALTTRLTTPLAVGVVSGSDTLVLRVGGVQ